MFRRIARFTILAFLLIPVFAQAQSHGVLTGTIFNGATGDPVRGATISVEGTSLATTSDLNGIFTLRVPPGTYSLSVRLEGFTTEVVSNAVVGAGAENNLAVILQPAEGNSAARISESVTVTASADTSTEEALLLERKSADEISDNVSKEEISKTASSSAAGVMQRVTGVTLVDDKYVYVRGLGERYSNTVLNGTVLSTTEPEKRVVPFDLFATALLGKVTVLKSYTPDRPGEFGGGVVELETLDFPASPTLSLSVGGTYADGATGSEFHTFGGGLGWSGSGGLGMPQGLPEQKVVRKGFSGTGFSRDELQTIGRSFQHQWDPSTGSAPMGSSYSLTYGTTIGRFGAVLSGSYNSGFSRDEEQRNFYGLGDEGSLRTLNAYSFDTSEENVRIGVTGNFAFRATPNHQMKLKTLSTQLASSEVRYFEGFSEDAFMNLRDTRLSYDNEEINSAQLSGEHFFKPFPSETPFSTGMIVEWKAARSRGGRSDDLREVLYEEQSPGRYVLADESQSGFMLFNELEDESDEYGVSASTFVSGRVSGTLKAGGSVVERNRDFESRRFRFVPQPSARLDLTRTPQELFTEENIGPNGFEINEETRPTDTYTGEQTINAAYAMADLTLGRWRVIGGARLEDSTQSLVTFDQFNLDAPPIITDNADTDLLPALSVVYAPNTQMNLRAAYSLTLNRPEFRELAPFEFTDVQGGRAVIGNPELQQAEITSYDLRWEWFPSAAEVVAASVFFKSFDKPIERIIQSTAQRRETFANVEKAENFGLELEFRRNLAFVRELLAPLTVIANYTWVDSKIDIGEVDLSVLTNAERPLVGQADQVVNTTVEYDSRALGAVVRLLYNYSGEKISDAGSYGLPDIIEEPRSTVDLVWMQSLGRVARGLNLKVSAKNLTDEEKLFTQGGLLERRYAPGREVSMSFGYKVF